MQGIHLQRGERLLDLRLAHVILVTRGRGAGVDRALELQGLAVGRRRVRQPHLLHVRLAVDHQLLDAPDRALGPHRVELALQPLQLTLLLVVAVNRGTRDRALFFHRLAQHRQGLVRDDLRRREHPVARLQPGDLRQLPLILGVVHRRRRLRQLLDRAPRSGVGQQQPKPDEHKSACRADKPGAGGDPHLRQFVSRAMG